MTLDELVTAIRITSSDPVACQLADLLAGWKDDKADATELERTVERFFGNAWIASSAEHAQIYSLWSNRVVKNDRGNLQKMRISC